MARCIFDKKANIKGYRKCEITGQYKRYICYNNWSWFNRPCKYFKANIWNTFIHWLDDNLKELGK